MLFSTSSTPGKFDIMDDARRRISQSDTAPMDIKDSSG